MKTLKRILALAAIIILIGLYITTLVLAILDMPGASSLFDACIYATIAVPILCYVLWMIIKLVNKDKNL